MKEFDGKVLAKQVEANNLVLRGYESTLKQSLPELQETINRISTVNLPVDVAASIYVQKM